MKLLFALLLSTQFLQAQQLPGPVASAIEEYDTRLFYEELAPYGRWISTAQYGEVWQPTVAANPEWRPYTLGEWVDTEQGFAWVSEEPFGWACYHYGRWVLLAPQGWCWVSGTQWAPAWVAWRTNDEHVGWAPLSPDQVDLSPDYTSYLDTDLGLSADTYTYIPARNLCDGAVKPHCLSRSVCRELVATTRSACRIELAKDKIRCQGPEEAWIKKNCPKPIKKLKLQCDTDRKKDHHQHLSEKEVRFYCPKLKRAEKERQEREREERAAAEKKAAMAREREKREDAARDKKRAEERKARETADRKEAMERQREKKAREAEERKEAEEREERKAEAQKAAAALEKKKAQEREEREMADRKADKERQREKMSEDAKERRQAEERKEREAANKKADLDRQREKKAEEAAERRRAEDRKEREAIDRKADIERQREKQRRDAEERREKAAQEEKREREERERKKADSDRKKK
jgi:hypothetical protein